MKYSCFLLMAIVFASSAHAAPPTLDIKGPAAARVGDIVILDASASKVDHLNWMIDTTDVAIPSDVDTSGIESMVVQLKALGFNVQSPDQAGGPLTYFMIDDGKKIITASYPGTWKFYVAGSNAEGVTQKVWKVEVKENGGNPIPPPTTIPKFNLASQAPNWVAKVPAASRSQSAGLKAALTTVGNDAIKGQYASIETAEAAVGTAIVSLVSSGKLNSADWQSFGQSLNLAFTALRATGMIKTPNDYGYALLEVAGAM